MAQDPTIDKNLLDRFFNDQCTDAEREVVLNWMANPEHELLVRNTMEHHWRAMQRTENRAAVDIEQLLTKTSKKIFDEEGQSVNAGDGLPGGKPKLMSWSIAALWLGALLTFSVLIFLTTGNEPESTLTSEKEKIKIIPDTKVLKSASGQIIEEVLPDGTKVILNAQSSLQFPSAFSGQSAREVILTGEAFFDVTEDKDHPFIVKTHGINVVVLGTAFNLKSYKGDPTIETTLIRGKVVVENNKGQTSKKVEMKPNQKAVFSHDTENITLVDVNLTQTAPWNKATLEFEQEELYNVIKSLERWYGVTIHTEKEVSMNCQLTARIDRESLKETMEVLKSLMGIRYSILEKDVFIKGKICEK